MNEWQEIRLGDLVARGSLSISDGYRVRNEELGPQGIPFVRGGDIGDGWINTDTIDHIRPELANRVRAKLAGPGDVAFITKGTVGRAGRLRPGQPNVVFAPQVAYWRVLDPHALDAVFLFYLIRSHEFQSALNGVKTHGSMVADYVSISLQHDFVFKFPDIGLQRAIAHILGALDDKIELNLRMNETLEAMARSLFESWFVDFDPVRAKADGRDPGLPKHIADLFPNLFEDSELGKIPKGWRPSSLGDEVSTLLGGTPARGERAFWGGNIPWINSGKANEFRILEPSEYITQAGLQSSATKLLPPRTTVIAITGATLGQVSLAEIATCANQSIVGVLGNEKLPSEFIYFWVRENINRLIASQTGGAQQHVNKNDINALPVICPSAHVIRAYVAETYSCFERIKSACIESRTLIALRDALLPKLISGEVRVKDAEKFVAAVA